MPSQMAKSVQAQVRRMFDRRAATFDRVEFLPREIAGRMQERLDYIKASPQRILDAGCGLGRDLTTLATRYPTAQLTGVDLSTPMLRRARAHSSAALDEQSRTPRAARRWLPDSVRRLWERQQPFLVQSDYADLPFMMGAYDMVWSNLALQWHRTPDQVFPEWQRVLSVGGLLMFSTLGPDTLKELRAAWIEADQTVRSEHGDPSPSPSPRAPVLDFVDMHDFGDMLVASGFELPVMDMETLKVTYRDPAALLADVRGWGGFPTLPVSHPPGTPSAMGARSTLDETAAGSGLGGRGMQAALHAALARQRAADGTISLTFEVVYGHAWKAQPRLTADGQAIVRLDQIGGRRRRTS